ncbi:MAG: MarR family transcriptional regulator [Candidatus Acidiferrales bacterium]
MTHPAIDYQALAGFRYEIRRFLNFSENAARAAGIEPQQHQALLALKGLPPALSATVGALAERLQIRHHSAVELSRRLEAKGLLERTRSHSDAREVLLRVSARGEHLLERLSLAHRDELRTAGPRLIEALRLVVVHSATPRMKRAKNKASRKRMPI